MSNSINDLKIKIDKAGGVQRSNRYSVEIYPSSEIFSGQLDILNPKQIVFGGRQIDTIADKLPGPGLGRMVPLNISYLSLQNPNLLITFPSEQNWSTYNNLEKWMNTLVNDGSNPDFFYGFSFSRPYDLYVRKSNIIIKCLDMNGNAKSKFVFREVYPVAIMPIQMSALISNQILMYDVLFNFRNYTAKQIL